MTAKPKLTDLDVQVLRAAAREDRSLYRSQSIGTLYDSYLDWHSRRIKVNRQVDKLTSFDVPLLRIGEQGPVHPPVATDRRWPCGARRPPRGDEMNTIRRWLASALTKLSRRKDVDVDRNGTYGPRVHNYRLPDGGVGYVSEGGRGGRNGQDGEDGAGPYGGKGGRGGGGGAPLTYGQPPDDTDIEEQP